MYEMMKENVEVNKTLVVKCDNDTRNVILVTKFRVSYVKITSTQRNTGKPPFGPHDRL